MDSPETKGQLESIEGNENKPYCFGGYKSYDGRCRNCPDKEECENSIKPIAWIEER